MAHFARTRPFCFRVCENDGAPESVSNPAALACSRGAANPGGELSSWLLANASPEARKSAGSPAGLLGPRLERRPGRCAVGNADI